jgi:hypothetical protein
VKLPRRRGPAIPVIVTSADYYDEVNSCVYSFLFRRRWFSPPWPVDADNVYKNAKLLPGVRTFPGYPNRLFFNLRSFLAYQAPQAELVPGLEGWLQERFKKPRPVNSAPSNRFAPKEDAAILQHYHENPDWDAIRSACPRRSRLSIQHRARDLCKALVAAGERDLAKLPLLRRSGSFLRWFNEQEA